jgi:hypothetical protein
MDKRKSPSLFVPKSYHRSNKWALNLFCQYLIKKKFEIINSEENYGLDITAKFKNKVFYFEIETKTGYKFTSKKDFKFGTVSFLARKKKWADLGFLYVIICRETRYAILCHSKVIYQDKYKTDLTINSAERIGSDEFYRVPKDICKWVNLNI